MSNPNLALGALLRLREAVLGRSAPYTQECRICTMSAPFGKPIHHSPLCPIPQAEQALREAGLLPQEEQA